MAAATSITSNKGNIRLEAVNEIALRTITAGSGSIALITGTSGSIVDAANTADANITASGLIMTAGAAIGSGTNHIDTTVTTLTANAGTGGVFVTESDTLVVDTVDFNVSRVNAQAGVADQNSAQEDLSTTADGAIVLTVNAGGLTVNDGTDESAGVTATGSGNVLLNVTGQITLDAGLNAGSGHISVVSSDTFTQNANMTTTGTGTVDVRANAIDMNDGAATSAEGNIRYVATTTLALGQLTTSGNISLSASSITDANDAVTAGTNNLTADELRIVTTGTAAGNGAGTSANHLELNVATLAADVKGTDTGGLYITEANALQIGTLNAINVNQVGTDGTTLTATTDVAQSHLNSAANLVLVTTEGGIETLSVGGLTTAAGNLLLQANGTTSDLTLGGTVTNTAGHTSLEAGQDILVNANISATTVEGNTIDLKAGDDITMAAATSITSNKGNIRLEAVNEIALRTITAGSGSIALITGTSGSIVDAANTTDANITASGLIMTAGAAIGSGANHIDTTVTTLTANAGTGGVFVTESDTLVVDTVDFNVSRVNAQAGVADENSAQEDLNTTADGAIVLTVNAGGLTVNDGTDDSAGVTATGSGNVLLNVTGQITLDAGLHAGSGHISVVSSDTFTQNANGDMTATGAGTIDVRANAIDMNAAAVTTAENGNIRYVATTTLALGQLTTAGDISLSASSITDANDAVTAGTNNLTADELRIVTTGTDAGNGVGTSANHLELNVATLAADVAGTDTGGLYITEADALQISTLNAINVNQVGTDGTTLTATTDVAQSNLNSAGNLVIVAAGSIETATVANGGAVSAAGNLLLQANGTSSDLTLGGTVTNTAGHTSLEAGRDILVNANISATTIEGNTIDLKAGDDITMAAATSITSNKGNIRLEAVNTIALRTITAGSTEVGSGNVALITGTSGSIVDAANTTDANITASGLIMTAGAAIGSGANHIDTTVTTLTANAGAGGVFVTESDTLVVDTVDFNVSRVNAQAGVADQNSAQEDLNTTADGAIVLTVNAGGLTVNDGTDDSAGVTATGSGNVLLNVTGQITLDAGLHAGSGHISVVSSDTFTQNANGDMTATGAGTIDVRANAIDMNAAAVTTAENGNIRYVATTTLALGQLTTAGDISLSASSITDANDAVTAGTNNLTADELRIVTTGTDAGNGVGTSANHLELNVATLAADVAGTDTGGLYITEADALQISTLNAINVNQVGTDGTTLTATTDVAQSNLNSAGNLVIVAAGSIETATVANGGAVTATGNLLLSAGGTTSNLTLNANVSSSAGNISLNAGQDVLQNADVSTTTAGNTIDVLAGKAITMADTSTTVTKDGNIRYSAKPLTGASGATHIMAISHLNAGTGSVSLVGGSVLDAGDAATDIVASNLRLNVTQGVGSNGISINALETTVTTLTASTRQNGLFINETDGLIIDNVADISVERVQSNATSVTTTDVAQEDISAISGGDVVISATDLTINAGTAGSRAIYLQGDGNAKLTATTGNLVVNGQVELDSSTTSGSLQLEAKSDITLAAVNQILLVDKGTVYLDAEQKITMASGSSLFTFGGDVRLNAVNNINLSLINAGTTGDVALNSTAGQVLDNQTTATSTNVVAKGLSINAHNGVGVSSNAIETTVTTWALNSANGSVFVSDTTSVVTGTVTVDVNTINSSGVASNVTSTLSGVTTAAGNIVLNAADTLTIANGAGINSTSGNVRLSTTNQDVVINSTIKSISGHLDVQANRNITQSATGQLVTDSSTINVRALSGSITMADGALAQTNGQNIRYQAAQAIQLGLLDTRTATDRTAGTITDQANWGSVYVNAASGSINSAGTMNLYANQARLEAGTSIGSSSIAMQSEVIDIAALASSGGIFVSEATSIDVDLVDAINVNSVATDGTVSTTTDASTLADLISGNNGNIVLTTLNGSIVINDGDTDGLGVVANGSGNIRIDANSTGDVANVTNNAQINSGTGHITVTAADALSILGNITTSTGGTITLDAEAGALSMGGAIAITATNSSARLNAATDLTVGNVVAKDVSLVADTGSIINAADSTMNVTASNLRLEADDAIGTSVRHLTTTVATISANSTGTDAQGIYVTEADSIMVGSVIVTTTAFNTDATTATITDVAQADLISGNNGNIVLTTLNGSIVINDGDTDGLGVVANGSGNIRIDANSTGDVANVTNNAQINSGTGHITVTAADALSILGNITTSTGGTITLDAEAGALSMGGAIAITATNSSARLNAATDLTVGNVVAKDVSLVADTGSIINAADSTMNVTASNLRLEADDAIGTSVRHLTTTVATISANSTGTDAQGIYVTEADSIMVGSVIVTTTAFNTDATTATITDVAQADLISGNNGNIVLTTLNGSIVINDGDTDGLGVVANGSGNIRIDANSTGDVANVTNNAQINSGTGHITVTAADALSILGNITTSTGGTITLDAEAGALSMGGAIAITATNSSARLNAATDLTVGNVVAKDVSLVADTGSIINAADSTMNVTASNLRLEADDAIGTSARHLTTTVATISANSIGTDAQGIYVTEADSIMVGSVIVTTTAFNTDATTATITDVAQADLISGNNGNIVLTTLNGSIVINDGDTDGLGVVANGSGNIRIDANSTGDVANVTNNAQINSGTGHITVTAADALSILGNITTSTGGTITLDAEAGALSMGGAIAITATNSSARLNAATDLTVGNVVAKDVSLVADTGSIINAADSTMNVTASNLRLEADDAIGTSVRHLTTTVATISANSTGTDAQGIYVTEADSIMVGSVIVTTTAFNTDATTATITDVAQADLISGNNGNIVLTTLNGSIVINDGDTDGLGVVANGSGNIRIDANSTGDVANVTNNAQINSGTGHITVTAADALSILGNITTSTGGTITLDAEAGALSMGGAIAITATNSSARLNAATDLTVGNVVAKDVSLVADTGSIINAADSTMNVTASNLRLEADDAIGTSARHLTTTVATISANSIGTDAQGIYVTEADSIMVGSVIVTTTAFNTDATTATITDVAQADLISGNNGNIVLTTLNGSIVINDGDTDGLGVVANGSGNIRIDANSTGDVANVTNNAQINSGTGHITVTAADALSILGNITTSTGGTITLDAEAGALSMGGAIAITATNSSARLNAATDLTVGNVVAKDVSLVADTGSIINAADSTMNVTASNLRLEADDAIGTSVRHLTTTVATISANSTGTDAQGIYVTEADSIMVGSVIVTTTAFNTDATTATITDVAQADLISGNNGNIVLTTLNGSIVINDGDTDGLGVVANGSGNIRIDANSTGDVANVTNNAQINSGTGHITVTAADALSILGNITTSTGGTITLDAEAGALSMGGAIAITATNSSARLNAATDLTVGNVVAKDVSLVADTGSIINAADSTMNVTASNLRLEADDAIGTSARHLTTTVATISANSIGTDAQGIYVTEADSIMVGSVIVTTTAFNTDATTATITDVAQADLISGNNGNIVLTTLNGSIVINDGDTDGLGVVANGSGNIRIDANSTGDVANVTNNAQINSGTGHITVTAADALSILGNITTSTGGTITLDAEAGALSMGGAIAITATNSSARLNAATDLTVGNVVAKDVSLVADTGSIINAADSTMNVTASNLRLEADDAIGTSVRHLTTTVATISANSTGTDAQGIYVTEADSIMVGSVIVTTTAFNTDATTATITDVAQADLISGNNGNIVLTTLNGSIVINDGDTDGLGVVAHGSGSVRIDANGTGSDVTNNAQINSGTGHITVTAADALSILGNITTSANGTITLDAKAGALTMADSAMITADSLSLSAGTSIGSATNAMNMTVDTLTASAGTGSVYVTDTDDLTVDSVSVGLTGDLQITADLIVLDNVQAANVSLIANKGDITFNDIRATTQATLLASGKLLAVADDSVSTNLTTPTFNVSSKGFYLDIQNKGFVEALAEVSDDMVKVRADVIIDKGILGESTRVTKDNRSYIVTKNTQENSHYAQFYSQNQNAKYDQLVNNTLTEEQFIQSLNAPREVNNLNEVFESNLLENSLTSRLQNEEETTSQGEVDDYAYITRAAVSDSAFQSSMQKIVQTQAKTQVEQQLETSILRAVDQGQRVNNGLSFETRLNQNRSTLLSAQSLTSDLVNLYGNRQIDVLGNPTSDYLFFYSIDENDEESILESIL